MALEFLPHVADIRMKIAEDNFRQLLTTAVRGMAELLLPETSGPRKELVTRKLELEASDPTQLLIDVLSEILTWSHIDKAVFDKIIIKELEDYALRACITGTRVESFADDIKAVTYHEADVRKTEEGMWETTVIFDV